MSFELVGGKKWMLENQHNKTQVTYTIDQAQMMHAAQIMNCSGCAVNVTSKLNSVTLVKCANSKLTVDSVVSSIELIDCHDITLDVARQLPQATIDKSKNVSVILRDPELSRETEIVHSGSSDLNIMAPRSSADTTLARQDLPHRFVTRFSEKKDPKTKAHLSSTTPVAAAAATAVTPAAAFAAPSVVVQQQHYQYDPSAASGEF